MKIAHIVESMEVGGAEKVVLALARWQKAQGQAVAVHCLFREGALVEELQRKGIDVHFHGAASRLRLTARLYRVFARERPRVVHCHNATATIIAGPPARFAGVPAVVSTRHGLAPPPFNRRREIQYSLAARGCTAVVAVCEAARRNLSGAPFADPARIETIYNGAEPAASRVPNPAVPAKTGFTVINVGRLTPAKDHAALFEATALACGRVPDLRLWLVGEGPLGPSLRQSAARLGIEDRIVFCGEQAQVGDFLAAADLFVLSSISEGLPVSLLEAMAAGLPVIVTDVGGMPEIVRPAKAGAVVAPSNPEVLAAAICDFAGRREQLRSLGEAARQYYREHCTLERMAEDYMRVYQSALARRQTS